MNNDFFHIDPVIQAGWLLILLPVAAFLLWKEFTRPQKYKYLRVTALILLLIAILGLIIRPSIRGTSSEAIVLLTKEYSLQKLDSLQSFAPHLKLYTLPGVKHSNAIQLASYNELADISDKIQFVIGGGLPPAALDYWNESNFQFINTTSEKGVVKLSVPDKIEANKAHVITGVFRAEKETSLLLLGPGGEEDSIRIDKGVQPFNLHFVPKQPGNHIYELAINDGTTKVRERIPIHVERAEPLKILILQYFPTFEVQYLKRFLAKENIITVRSQLSKNNYRYEHINTTKHIELKKLTTPALAEFDLLILDSDAFNTLSSLEVNSLRQSISDGLGALFVFNEDPDKSKSLKNLLGDFKASNSDTLIYKSKSKRITLSTFKLQPAEDDELYSTTKFNNRIVSGYRYHGLGKTGFQLLLDTYQLILEGDSIGYSKLWSELISKTARMRDEKFNIKLSEPPYNYNQPIHVQVIGPEQPEIFYDSAALPVVENAILDDEYTTRFWPNKTGWNSLTLPSDSIERFFYVHEENTWESLQGVQSINHTLMLQKKNSNTILKVIHSPIPSIIFFIIVLLSAMVLWLLPKIT